MRGSDFSNGILAAIILGAIYAGRRDMDPEARSRRRSNIIGLVVLVGFVIAMVCYGTYRTVQKAQKQEKAKIIVDQMAYEFAQNDLKPLEKWAKGEVVDPWENQVILIESSREGVRFASKGEDGELNTEDDVVSVVHFPPKKVIPKPPEEKKGVVSRVKSFFTGD
jgi:hypothetical protein